MTNELPEFDLPEWQPDLEPSQPSTRDDAITSTLPPPSGSRPLGLVTATAVAAMNTPEAVDEAVTAASVSLVEAARAIGGGSVYGLRFELVQDGVVTVLAYGTAVGRRSARSERPNTSA